MKARRPLHALTFTLAEARSLVEMFDGDEETEVSVAAGTKAAHSGPGLYGWWSDYTDEGSIKLGAPLETNESPVFPLPIHDSDCAVNDAHGQFCNCTASRRTPEAKQPNSDCTQEPKP